MNKDYREDLYENYAKDFVNSSGAFDTESAQRWKPCFNHYLRGWLPRNLESNILDLGCGEGRLLYLLQEMGYRNAEGVDISESQLFLARQITNDVYRNDVIEYLDKAERSFDLILAFDLIEHLDKNQFLTFLDLCRTRLASGGRVIFQTPNACSPFVGGVRYGDLTHEVCFTPKLLSQLMARSGFSSIEVREAGPVPGYSYKSKIRGALWWLIKFVFSLVEKIETGGASTIYTRVFLISGERIVD